MAQNVVELSQYRDRDHFPGLRCLGNYCHNLANSSVPYRADLDPRGLQDALSQICFIGTHIWGKYTFAHLRAIFVWHPVRRWWRIALLSNVRSKHAITCDRFIEASF